MIQVNFNFNNFKESKQLDLNEKLLSISPNSDVIFLTDSSQLKDWEVSDKENLVFAIAPLSKISKLMKEALSFFKSEFKFQMETSLITENDSEVFGIIINISHKTIL